MRILELYAENVMRLKVIQIRPKGNVVYITGQNEQGKTSGLNCIWFALGGKDAFSDTPRPIRDGQKEALISLDLGDMVVTRHWTRNDRSYLKVENKEGEKFDKPQELIDGFLGRLSFDPLEFSALSQREQRDLLLDFADLRELLASLATQKAALYEERTLLGRDLKTAEAQLDESELPPNLPEEEVSISLLTKKLEAAVNHNRQVGEHLAKKNLVIDAIADDATRVKDLKTQIAQLEAQITNIQKNSQVRLKTVAECEAFLNSNPPMNVAAIRIELHEADELNQFIRSAQRTTTLKKTTSKLKVKISTLTEQLTEVDEAKTKALQEAEMPIEDLSLDDDGVIYDGMPFSGGAKMRRTWTWTIHQLAKLDKVVEVLNSLGTYWPLTLRQLYYQLVAQNYIPNKISEYKALSVLLKHARLDNHVPWDAVEDRLREARLHRGWYDARQFIGSELSNFLTGYRRDLQQTQPNYIEVWLEKDALSSIFTRVVAPYCIPVCTCRGFSSVTFIHELAGRIQHAQAQERHPTILYFGAFDPSGEAMLPAIQATLEEEMGIAGVSYVKVALTPDQITKFHLPNDPSAVKSTDSRYEQFVARYGLFAVELDALPPADLEAMIAHAITEHLDLDLYEAERTLRAKELASLFAFKNRVEPTIQTLWVSNEGADY